MTEKNVQFPMYELAIVDSEYKSKAWGCWYFELEYSTMQYWALFKCVTRPEIHDIDSWERITRGELEIGIDWAYQEMLSYTELYSLQADKWDCDTISWSKLAGLDSVFVDGRDWDYSQSVIKIPLTKRETQQMFRTTDYRPSGLITLLEPNQVQLLSGHLKVWYEEEQKFPLGKVYSFSPNSKGIEVDSTITVKIKGKNIGVVAGNLYLSVVRADTKESLIYETAYNIPVDGLTDEYTATFIMPDKTFDVYFDVGHIVAGKVIWDDEEIATLTPEVAPPVCTVTCASDNCPNTLSITSGYDLLKHYDVDNDGDINYDEVKQAGRDYNAGIITLDEINFVVACWELPFPNINNKCPLAEATGEIIACNINEMPCPNCGNANAGQEISVIASMQNIGEVKGKFRFYIYDQDGKELSKEPDLQYKDVEPGDTWGVEKSWTQNLNFNMPSNAIINGQLKLVKLE